MSTIYVIEKRYQEESEELGDPTVEDIRIINNIYDQHRHNFRSELSKTENLADIILAVKTHLPTHVIRRALLEKERIDDINSAYEDFFSDITTITMNEERQYHEFKKMFKNGNDHVKYPNFTEFRKLKQKYLI